MSTVPDPTDEAAFRAQLEASMGRPLTPAEAGAFAGYTTAGANLVRQMKFVAALQTIDAARARVRLLEDAELDWSLDYPATVRFGERAVAQADLENARAAYREVLNECALAGDDVQVLIDAEFPPPQEAR
jgi:hypothetical protein